MIKSLKVRLKPNNKQLTKLFQFAGCARYVYNWALTREIENCKNGGRFIRDNELRKEFTQLKKNKEKNWINDVSNNVTKQAIKDACKDFKCYLDGKNELPKFKNKKYSKPSFFQDPYKIRFSDTHVKVEKFTESRRKNRQNINWIRLCEKGRIPTEVTYLNPRFTYDGLYWYVSVSIEVEDIKVINYNKGIGIDLGVINLAVCSDGHIYKSINKSRYIHIIERREKRLKKSISRKYEKNKKDGSYVKTENIIKAEKKILRLKQKMRDKRKDYMCKVISDIISRRPRYICIEDLDISNMLKNRRMSKAIQNQSLYDFRKKIIYKANLYNIVVVIADRYFPSSKRCVKCGRIKRDLSLSDRVYYCECGNVIDRDLQASLNLMLYGRAALRNMKV